MTAQAVTLAAGCNPPDALSLARKVCTSAGYRLVQSVRYSPSSGVIKASITTRLNRGALAVKVVPSEQARIYEQTMACISAAGLECHVAEPIFKQFGDYTAVMTSDLSGRMENAADVLRQHYSALQMMPSGMKRAEKASIRRILDATLDNYLAYILSMDKVLPAKLRIDRDLPVEKALSGLDADPELIRLLSNLHREAKNIESKLADDGLDLKLPKCDIWFENVFITQTGSSKKNIRQLELNDTDYGIWNCLNGLTHFSEFYACAQTKHENSKRLEYAVKAVYAYRRGLIGRTTPEDIRAAVGRIALPDGVMSAVSKMYNLLAIITDLRRVAKYVNNALPIIYSEECEGQYQRSTALRNQYDGYLITASGRFDEAVKEGCITPQEAEFCRIQLSDIRVNILLRLVEYENPI